jgi:flagellar basal-body rod protein FlgF
MVDTALFVGMSGAKESMHALQMISNNLANSSTVGFRADFNTLKPVPTNQEEKQTRVYSGTGRSYSDFTPGPTVDTGNELDVSLNGPGFIAVQTKEGKEAYTRAGNLRITPQGLLTTAKGDLVLGAKGVINIPPATRISIGEKGVVSVQLKGDGVKDLTDVGTIKLVNASPNLLQKGHDGLFYLENDGTATVSDSIRLIPRTLEGSNVNPVHALAELIEISRQFEMHTKLMSAIEDNSVKSNQLLDVSE